MLYRRHVARIQVPEQPDDRVGEMETAWGMENESSVLGFATVGDNVAVVTTGATGCVANGRGSRIPSSL